MSALAATWSDTMVLARRNLEQALYGMIVAAARPPQDPRPSTAFRACRFPSGRPR